MAPAGLTGLVRLVKRWIKIKGDWSKTDCPNSYCMELVMHEAYKNSTSHLGKNEECTKSLGGSLGMGRTLIVVVLPFFQAPF